MQLKKLSDLKLHSKNANLGTERGRKMLKASLAELGAGRSILVDRSGNIIAGNKTAETAKDLKRHKIRVVQTTGDELVVVQRTDLDINSKKARKLAIADNRVAEIDLNWNADVLKALDLDLGEFWSDKELALVTGEFQPGSEDEQSRLDITVEIECPKCGNKFRRP